MIFLFLFWLFSLLCWTTGGCGPLQDRCPPSHLPTHKWPEKGISLILSWLWTLSSTQQPHQITSGNALSLEKTENPPHLWKNIPKHLKIGRAPRPNRSQKSPPRHLGFLAPLPCCPGQPERRICGSHDISGSRSTRPSPKSGWPYLQHASVHDEQRVADVSLPAVFIMRQHVFEDLRSAEAGAPAWRLPHHGEPVRAIFVESSWKSQTDAEGAGLQHHLIMAWGPHPSQRRQPFLVSASYASMFVSKDGAGNLCKMANQHNNSLSLWFYGVKHAQTFLSVAAKTPGANLDTKLKWSPSEDFNLTAGPADIQIRLGRARFQQQQHVAALSAWKLQLIQPRCW